MLLSHFVSVTVKLKSAENPKSLAQPAASSDDALAPIVVYDPQGQSAVSTRSYTSRCRGKAGGTTMFCLRLSTHDADRCSLARVSPRWDLRSEVNGTGLRETAANA